MPRNKSEVHPHREKFFAYADATQQWIADGSPTGPSTQDDILSDLWWLIPEEARKKMVLAVTAAKTVGSFQERCLVYIRETYGESDAA